MRTLFNNSGYLHFNYAGSTDPKVTQNSYIQNLRLPQPINEPLQDLILFLSLTQNHKPLHSYYLFHHPVWHLS
jgi:hypothetical protein